ncbi:MAG TPA: RHS repeat-associated core domain-containing protein [Gaiellaceae bacterium]|nr:RHS repeat-associated core domain-containing protein [Gaiellaceae bacterium]
METVGYSEAQAINDSGTIVGGYDPNYNYPFSNPRTEFATVWNSDGTSVDLGTLPGALSSVAYGINSSGVIVGSVNDGGDGFVYIDGTMYDLNDLIAPGSGYTVGQAVGIDNAGDIIAYTSKNGLLHSAILIPLTGDPPPGAPTVESTYGPCQNPRFWHTVSVQEACAQMAADPVNLATGAVSDSATDASMPSIGEPFAFTRSYTSLDTATSELGVGWTDSYADTLTFGSGTITWRSGSGAQIVFTQQADGSYQAPPFATVTLTSSGGGYEIVTSQQTHYLFDGQGRLTAVRDRNGQGVSLTYDANGNRSSLTDSAGRVVTFEHDASGLLARMVLPDGRDVRYGYTNGYLTSVTDLRGNTYTYGYDAQNRLSTEVDQNNHPVVTNAYGPDGRISQQEDGDGNITHFAWDPNTSTATVTDARNHTWTYTFRGTELTSETDPYGHTSTCFYDSSGNLAGYQDALGNIESYGYDSRHNMTSRTAPAPLSYTERWTYDPLNDPLTYKDGRGTETDYTYDANGNLTSTTKPGNIVTSYTVDPATGLVTAITDPRGKTTHLGYDPTTHQLTSETTPLGEKTTFAYDSTGRLTSSVEPRGNQTGVNPADYTTTYGYDNADHLTSVTSPDPDGSGPLQPLVRQWAYDPAGNLESTTDPRGYSTLYGYDTANRLTSVSAPDPGSGRPVTQYGYDAVGNLTSRTDANNHVTSYGYDNANHLTSITTPLLKTWTYGYDANGDRTNQTDPKNGVTTYGYDPLGRLTSISYSDSTPAVSYSYDANNNLTQMQDGAGTATYTYNPLNELTAATRGSNTFSYIYDPAGNLTQTTYPDATVITRTYNDDERLATVATGGQTTSYGYDPAGNLTTTTLPNGYVETRNYDQAGRLTGLTNAKGTTTLSAFALKLDPDGNPTISLRSGATSETDTYTYDTLDRLTSVCFQTSCPGQTDPYIKWTYDAVGNRLTEARPTGTTNYTYNAADQLTQAGSTTYDYDLNGNETSAGSTTFTYDLANRMTSATSGSTTTAYTYDGLGKRLQASSGTKSITNYLWDISSPLPQLALEKDGSNTLIRRYIYGQHLISMNNGSAFYYHYDPLGSVVNLTTATGTTETTDSYEPFGAVHSEAINDRKAPTNPIKFAGAYLDSTGLYHLAARQYDPSTGRFTSTDPKPTTPTQPFMSSYVYAKDEPTLLIDPTGMGAVGNSCTSVGCFVQQEVAPYVEGCAFGAAQTAIVAAVTGGGSLVAGCAEGVFATAIGRNVSETLGHGLEGASTGRNLSEIYFAQPGAESRDVRVLIVVATG